MQNKGVMLLDDSLIWYAINRYSSFVIYSNNRKSANNYDRDTLIKDYASAGVMVPFPPLNFFFCLM